jgi:hypothetical protein
MVAGNGKLLSIQSGQNERYSEFLGSNYKGMKSCDIILPVEVLIHRRRTKGEFPAPWGHKNIPIDTPLLAAG